MENGHTIGHHDCEILGCNPEMRTTHHYWYFHLTYVSGCSTCAASTLPCCGRKKGHGHALHCPKMRRHE
jgi:hypothetical protein